MPDLDHQRFVLGLTGGIACYKSAELLRRMQDHGATVDVVMTEAATRFITPTTMQALSGRPVHTQAWDDRVPNSMAHINLTRGARAVVIAPASADFLAKLAHGLADDLLSTLCLAKGACPLLVAPAMNREMWEHPATQRNIQQLRRDGVHVLGPGSGEQACGEVGDGRMLEPAQLLQELIAFGQEKTLAGRRVVITAGPTSEKIDPIRVITNRSSGKTGYALARAAAEAGAHVVLISGPTALPAPYGVLRVDVESAADMHAAVMANVDHADIFVSVAAVADWHVTNASDQKLKKTSSDQPPALQFAPNPDILAAVARMPDGPWCVGFAAETESLHENAQAKRLRKGVPLLVGNLAQESMGGDTTRFVLFDDQGVEELPMLSKTEAARRLVQAIAARLPGKA
ncbi:MAG TPA: bifunctional phosphopantothenoylcysteine decarboxylase/phosphopantothenate--cysteine ligase CoaBC [Pusillimonas sp.]|uniref:bifunctional phosphopantothenoylcysteine decarboxylase/phosphopantothenate--cysteine ligase CoaBC n=1 Tax=Pusillimonas sp. TaxID=3040095 RepID=UPI002BF9D4D2|nr:bifunctional phosphopantothenoylcysteine decarboxylase/phosphopantothenate--cysteine ligase CoaBC [Pusillimonas sp.]HUH86847.1 bifunctional phosphopantothenoylcysteine decarboxylase/phosphopantothenate--cysteine ligase CoaBC [Pusillimonas sp.]